MKKVALLGLALVVVLAGGTAVMACDGDAKEAKTEQAELAAGQVRVAVPVSGMTCGGCCTKVETAVAELDGVVDVKADYKKGVATIVYEEDKIELASIIDTINTKTSFKAAKPKQHAS
jgi:copper chaperone CopZ